MEKGPKYTDEELLTPKGLRDWYYDPEGREADLARVREEAWNKGPEEGLEFESRHMLCEIRVSLDDMGDVGGAGSGDASIGGLDIE